MAGPDAAVSPGMRARASYVRFSAYKARAMLDLIRGRSCVEAYGILALSERAAAKPIAKVLDSAVANAEHNGGLDADDLYVAACYADEGPTLKRWRPRARGRSARIRKRTCHITVVVRRYDQVMLDRMRSERSAARRRAGASPAESRRLRVARSRQRQAAQRQAAAAAAGASDDAGASDGAGERGAGASDGAGERGAGASDGGAPASDGMER